MDWFDEVIRKILKVKDHEKLAHTTNLIRKRMNIERQLKTPADELKHTEEEMTEQDMDPLASSDYVMQFFGGDTLTLF